MGGLAPPLEGKALLCCLTQSNFFKQKKEKEEKKKEEGRPPWQLIIDTSRQLFGPTWRMRDGPLHFLVQFKQKGCL